MRQIIALILVSVLAFAGIIFIKDYRLGNLGSKDQKVSDAEAKPANLEVTDKKNEAPAKKVEEPTIKDVAEPAEEPETTIAAIAPKALIGTFAIDKPATEKWLLENDYGTEFDIEAHLSLWPLLLIDFDGKQFKIDSGDKTSKQPFQPTEQTDDQLIIPLNLRGSSSTSYTITWDDKGFWAAYTVPKPGSNDDFQAQVRFNRVSE